MSKIHIRPSGSNHQRSGVRFVNRNQWHWKQKARVVSIDSKCHGRLRSAPIQSWTSRVPACKSSRIALASVWPIATRLTYIRYHKRLVVSQKGRQASWAKAFRIPLLLRIRIWFRLLTSWRCKTSLARIHHHQRRNSSSHSWHGYLFKKRIRRWQGKLWTGVRVQVVIVG